MAIQKQPNIRGLASIMNSEHEKGSATFVRKGSAEDENTVAFQAPAATHHHQHQEQSPSSI